MLGTKTGEQGIILSGKSLNRPTAIPVACAEHEVYFGNGVEERETDTLLHWFYLGLTTVYADIVAMHHHKTFSVRTEYVFGLDFVLQKGFSGKNCQ